MKESFVLYTEILETVREMTDEEAGVLFKMILHHEADEEYMPGDGHIRAEVAFSFIRRQLDRCDQKHAEIVEKRRSAAQAGARARWAKDSESMRTDATACDGMRTDAIDALNVPVPVPDPVPVHEKKKRTVSDVVDGLDAPDDVREKLREFAEMRKSMRSPMTPKAMELLWSKLRKMAVDEPHMIAILDQSILSGWKSVYPLKEDKMLGGNRFNSFSMRQTYDIADFERRQA